MTLSNLRRSSSRSTCRPISKVHRKQDRMRDEVMRMVQNRFLTFKELGVLRTRFVISENHLPLSISVLLQLLIYCSLQGHYLLNMRP